MTGLSAGAGQGRVGVSFQNLTPAAVNTQLVDPASNVNGIVIRNAFLYAAGAASLSLHSGNAVPTSATSNPLIGFAVANGGTWELKRDIFVPPGQGLYYVSSLAAGLLFLDYDVL